jgi:hypothetical protein
VSVGQGVVNTAQPSSSATTKLSSSAHRGRWLWHRLLRTVAGGAFLGYLVWQIHWLSKGQVPPALFLALTGWPAPTTGGTRAILFLLRGDWHGSLHANALAVPMTLLLVFTLSLLGGQLLRGRRLRLPGAVVLAWVIILSTAWIIQLSLAVLTR